MGKSRESTDAFQVRKINLGVLFKAVCSQSISVTYCPQGGGNNVIASGPNHNWETGEKNYSEYTAWENFI